MRLMLDESEIAQIIADHFDDTAREDVIISVEDNVVVAEIRRPLQGKKASIVFPPGVRNLEGLDVVEDPSPGTDGQEGRDGDLHPAAILSASSKLAREIDEKNPRLGAKGLRGLTTISTPGDWKKEL